MIMARQTMRFVHNVDSNVFVSNERPESIYIPPFSLAGPSLQITTQRWIPPHSIFLQQWYVTALTTGTSTLTVALLLGDELFNTTGSIVASIDLVATKRSVSGVVGLPNKTRNYPIITPDNWIAIAFSGESEHEDIAVQMYGKAV